MTWTKSAIKITPKAESDFWLEEIFVSDLNKLTKFSKDKKFSRTWGTIYQHSMAKLSKSYAERCFAPSPLPEEVNRRLNEQIENSRDLLLELLFEQNRLNKIA
jgi:hypothetical protein